MRTIGMQRSRSRLYRQERLWRLRRRLLMRTVLLRTLPRRQWMADRVRTPCTRAGLSSVQATRYQTPTP